MKGNLTAIKAQTGIRTDEWYEERVRGAKYSKQSLINCGYGVGNAHAIVNVELSIKLHIKSR